MGVTRAVCNLWNFNLRIPVTPIPTLFLIKLSLLRSAPTMTMTITLFNGPFTRTRALVGGFVLLCSSFFFSALIFMCVVVDRGPRRSLATFTRFGELRFPLICLVVGCTMYCIYFVGIMVYFQVKKSHQKDSE